MWKWIVGVALLIVVVIGGTCWYAFHTLTSGGNATSVTIGATPDHVFAMLADRDSMRIWMAADSRPGSGHGILAVGDTARVDSTTRQVRNGMPARTAWIVSAIVPGQLLVTEVRDTLKRLQFERRDSVAAVGDSAILVSAFELPGIDSIRTARGDTSSAVGTFEKIIVSAFRLRAEGENQTLKTHVEGKPVAKP